MASIGLQAKGFLNVTSPTLRRHTFWTEELNVIAPPPPVLRCDFGSHQETHSILSNADITILCRNVMSGSRCLASYQS